MTPFVLGVDQVSVGQADCGAVAEHLIEAGLEDGALVVAVHHPGPGVTRPPELPSALSTSDLLAAPDHEELKRGLLLAGVVGTAASAIAGGLLLRISTS